uniref:NADH-ubiquinone oxidoreductase chain 4 n=1 Tax=Sinentomon erythranum TaxID=289455 RepID=G3D5N6_9HEXA|nr:NADH dehydrogenase subunit 4 [Sinentomon erythranum]ADN32963.1 NADH dehydrogenase subunit 4 [Sinentomon erythranum]
MTMTMALSTSMNMWLTIMMMPTMMLMLMLNNPTSMSFKTSMMWMDNTSMLLTMLTMLITSLSILSMNNMENKMKSKKMKLMFMTMSTMVMIMFTSKSMMPFYISFEASLIPMFMIITMWGKQPEKIQSSIYMMMYTILSSLMMLTCLAKMNFMGQKTLMIMSEQKEMTNTMTMMLMLPFLVKLPIFTLHTWLPKAHVESPVGGSMYLAGILLKLGVYGMMRTIMFYSKNTSNLMTTFTMWGCILSTIMTLSQSDMKTLIAYSSVVHMSILVPSLYSSSKSSIMSSTMIMLGHGMCSSALFFLSDTLYKKSNSRNMYMNKNQMHKTPSNSMWWMIMTAANLGMPFSLNLLGELFLFSSMMMMTKYMMFSIMIYSLMTSTYSIYMYAYTQYGSNKKSMSKQKTNTMQNLMLLIHFMPLYMTFTIMMKMI